ncbi:FAD-dependent oxidoreductase [Arthrobacter oryzae]|uniref:2-polyprenyl-6-methoxyphenol hydroxylase-like FAD-dependent oxidoreductase n=1 Tax=Arthrobacter oryzae TaxID=409290 RepID=A0A495FLZ5_9MICC|nr:NAD(P)/FAD-dependent oxidoreductase [Arthrobacter oryzae]RKR30264.1 2-polyprenyl-6-methoxyphenol hydroxylase-like FAD-dependent oxidoreductase [Arthrobacter oryzae]
MPDVLIIGAGPVGLYMAALLLQEGVDVQVLEQRSTPEAHSRAIGIHPPALAALARAGVGEALIAEGVRIRRGVALAGGKALAEMTFAGVSARFPFILSLPQGRTEALLERRLNDLGDGALHRGVRLTGLSDDGGQVTVEAVSRFGAVRYAAPLVLAADGVRSPVRTLRGIGVRARDYPDRYLMGDFADQTGFGPDAALFLSGEGIVESFPLPGQLRRWVVRLGAGDCAAGAPAADDVAQRCGDAGWLAQCVRERTGFEIDAGTNSMLSSFGVRTRLARRMVAGRIVVIGDAAHEVSPIGGQGMNLGWLDAAALAPIVTAAVRGEDVTDPIKTFERTRLKAAGRAARQAEINMALGRPLPDRLLALRNRAISGVAAVPAANSMIARRFTMH